MKKIKKWKKCLFIKKKRWKPPKSQGGQVFFSMYNLEIPEKFLGFLEESYAHYSAIDTHFIRKHKLLLLNQI